MKKIIDEILKTGKFSGYRANSTYMYGGYQVQLLEKEWAKHFKVKHAIACNSATSGLWAALGCLVKNNRSIFENIIVTPYSMTCSASLPLLFGKKVHFADIEPDYFCISPKSFKKVINANTTGIIVVDLFGMPYDPEIDKIAKDNGLWIIEDAAQAIGSKRNGKYCGTLGDIGVYSLNQHKHLSSGEGGIIVTDNDDLALKLRLLINHAEAINNELNNNSLNELVGMNLRMTEITAAIARYQLKNIDNLINPYVTGAKDFDISIRPGCASTYYKYATFNKVNPNHEKYDFKQGYITPLYKMPLFRNLGYRQNLCPICEKVEKNIFIGSLKNAG